MQNKSFNDYYRPAEDTLFLAAHLGNEKGKRVLDIGTGSGFLAKILLPNFDQVIATDINLNALQKAHETVENCICCNGAEPIVGDIDLAVCNLPYLPSEKVRDPAVDGSLEGLVIPTALIESASRVLKKNAKLLYLTSSLANYAELIKRTEKLGLSTKIIATKKLFFEELVLVECIKL